MKRFVLLILSVGFFFISACSHQHLFRFAWFSDTHISGTSSGEDDLSAAVRDINQLGNIDFVIVSGDITDLNIGNYLQKTKNVLDELNIPYHIIPGNHDTKWTDTGNQNFVDLWGADKFTFSGTASVLSACTRDLFCVCWMATSRHRICIGWILF